MKTPEELRTEARSYRIEAAAVEAEADRLEQAALEAAKPKEPDLLGGATIVTFTKYESGRIYSYAAVGWRLDRRQSRWAITASVKPARSGYGSSRVVVDEHGRYTWSGLLSFIGEANWPSIARVASVEYLLGDRAEPSVREVMGTYGKVAGTENVEPWHGKAGPFAPGGPV
jgi:hypothetical protein